MEDMRRRQKGPERILGKEGRDQQVAKGVWKGHGSAARPVGRNREGLISE